MVFDLWCTNSVSKMAKMTIREDGFPLSDEKAENDSVSDLFGVWHPLANQDMCNPSRWTRLHPESWCCLGSVCKKLIANICFQSMSIRAASVRQPSVRQRVASLRQLAERSCPIISHKPNFPPTTSTTSRVAPSSEWLIEFADDVFDIIAIVNPTNSRGRMSSWAAFSPMRACVQRAHKIHNLAFWCQKSMLLRWQKSE
jgi:hypothetical protein